jgi:hypothetical protein
MNTDGGTKDDVKVPEGKLGEEILAAFEVAETVNVTVTAAMGEEQVRSSLSCNFPGHNALCSRSRPSRSLTSRRKFLLSDCIFHTYLFLFLFYQGLSLVLHVLSFLSRYFQSRSVHVLTSRHCFECTPV